MKRIVLGILSIFMLSCAKDKGNYDYKDVNKVSVEAGATSFVAQQLEELVITPVLSESIASAGDSYTYEWTAYPVVAEVSQSGVKQEEPKPILLSKEKDLKEVIKLSPNSYFLQYVVTNTKTGLKAINRYPLTVNGAFYEGWLVMSNVNDKAQLSFIRKDNQTFLNPIKDINGLDLEGKGLKTYSGIISKMDHLYVFTDQTSYQFNANDFNLLKTEDDLFLNKLRFTDPYYTVNDINSDQYIINGGKVHADISADFGAPGKYSGAFGGEDADLFPYFFAAGKQIYNSFYDNKHKRFLFADYNSRVLRAFTPIVGASYDVTNVGKTMIAADLGMDGAYYTVMKDASGYYYYGYNPSLKTPADTNWAIQNSPALEKATAFAASSSLKHLYYTTDQAIYLYDIMANSSRKLYEFPANKKIKDIKMYKAKSWSAYRDPLYNRRLVVGTYDGKEGEVFFFDLTPTGDIEGGKYVQSFGDFGDIVQLNYRNPKE
ncbi:PKD-like family lipoprotein [Sphingobacterium tabacisoli]|uniref:PKD-like family lipoprotein n=1 Tax=Sphingobacterium tabacisoli TaxID=2044855 RepID=A0ABW5KYY2_9SPHI|nr:PKD-like family lipoprotein [Sphingobacterium tabacisoli]